ncbi:class I SAM-dependent methyltransferase [Planococcus sp. FY231025]|uniref:class I SAM-dependent methyltransferase n=1 Tax=Planococcus sp. FY231025 TaxID=3455699 RepID=UPI003F8E01F2
MENNIFEEMAKKYDTVERKALAEVVVGEVRKELRGSQAQSLLDYGSGTGLVSLELADLLDSVMLVDSSEGMLEAASYKIAQRGITNAEVLVSDFTQNKAELQADVILLSLVLLHIPDTRKILQELHGILTEGGKLIIVDFDKNANVNHPKIHNGFTHEGLKESLREAGFRNPSVRTFHHGPRIFAGQDASMFIASAFK